MKLSALLLFPFAGFLSAQPQVILDKDVNVASLISNQNDIRHDQGTILKFRKGDTLTIFFAPREQKGTFNFEMFEYENGATLFSRKSVREVNEDFVFTADKIIWMKYSTNFILPRSARMLLRSKQNRTLGTGYSHIVQWIERSDTSWIEIDEVVSVKKDTTYSLLIDKVVKVHSQTNPNGPRSYVPVTFPANTDYWVYWIGVGQESVDLFNKFSRTLSNGVSQFVPNPLIAFGLRLIPELPIMNVGNRVDFYLTDLSNASLFNQGLQFNHFASISTQRIVAGYRMVDSNQLPVRGGDTYALCFSNPSSINGTDVTVKAYAFVVTEKRETRKKRVVQSVNRTRVPY